MRHLGHCTDDALIVHYQKVEKIRRIEQDLIALGALRVDRRWLDRRLTASVTRRRAVPGLQGADPSYRVLLHCFSARRLPLPNVCALRCKGELDGAAAAAAGGKQRHEAARRRGAAEHPPRQDAGAGHVHQAGKHGVRGSRDQDSAGRRGRTRVGLLARADARKEEPPRRRHCHAQAPTGAAAAAASLLPGRAGAGVLQDTPPSLRGGTPSYIHPPPPPAGRRAW